jgi:hypothetical protein
MPLTSLALVLALAASPLNGTIHLVACAPGYPGTTEQAQPTMDDFARLLAAAAGWEEGRVTAEYQADEAAGVARLRADDTHVALIPLPMFFKYEKELQLEPLAQTVGPEGNADDTWSLVARSGRVSGPESLAGWTVIGIPAYAEDFVRGNILGRWGALPADTTLEFSRRVLGAIRRAAADENVAVILDGSQTAALAALPNAAALEVVMTSPAMPLGLVVSVGGRLGAEARDGLAASLGRIHPALAETLATVRVSAFAPVDAAALESGRRAFAAGR